jgi:hypothetical protein
VVRHLLGYADPSSFHGRCDVVQFVPIQPWPRLETIVFVQGVGCYVENLPTRSIMVVRRAALGPAALHSHILHIYARIMAGIRCAHSVAAATSQDVDHGKYAYRMTPVLAGGTPITRC